MANQMIMKKELNSFLLLKADLESARRFIVQLERQITILQAEKTLLTKLVLKLGGARGSDMTV